MGGIDSSCYAVGIGFAFFCGGFMSFRSVATAAAAAVGGSFKTVDARQQVMGRLADFLREQNIQIKTPEHLKLPQIQAFAHARLEAGICGRTLANELAAVRQVLRQVGREHLADAVRNAELGAGGSRAGTKTAMPEDRLSALRAEVLARDAGVAAVVDLQRALGLRAEEGVKSCKSLATWERQLTAGQPVRVVFGTKGGRPRDVAPADRARALEAVQAARALAARQGGVLIARAHEREAMHRYKNVMSAAGFKGRESGHSLRYAFARDQLAAYQAAGYSREEARALTSCDLGHGDGRGRYVETTYSR